MAEGGAGDTPGGYGIDGRLRAADELEQLLNEAEAAARAAHSRRMDLMAAARMEGIHLGDSEDLSGVGQHVRTAVDRLRADAQLDATAADMLNSSFDFGSESDASGEGEGAGEVGPSSVSPSRRWLYSPKDRCVSLPMNELEAPVRGDYEAIHRASGGVRARKAPRYTGMPPPAPASNKDPLRTPSPTFQSPPNARGAHGGPLHAMAQGEGETPASAATATSESTAASESGGVPGALAAAAAASRQVAQALEDAGGE